MYWLGVLFIVGGVAAAAVLGGIGLLRFSDTIDEFGRFRSTNAAEVTFEDSGTYTIYYESESKIDGETVNGPLDPPPGLQITVTNEDGDPVDTDRVDPDDGSIDEYGKMELPLAESDYEGEAVREVRIDEPGRYRFEATADTDDEFVIAIGKGSLASLLPWVLGALAAVGLGLLLGVMTIIVTAVKRGRRKRELTRIRAEAAQAAAFPYAAPAGSGVPAVTPPEPVAVPAGPPEPVGVPAGPPEPPARSEWAPPPTAEPEAPTAVATAPPAPAAPEPATAESPAPLSAEPPQVDRSGEWASSAPLAEVGDTSDSTAVEPAMPAEPEPKLEPEPEPKPEPEPEPEPVAAEASPVTSPLAPPAPPASSDEASATPAWAPPPPPAGSEQRKPLPPPPPPA
jgi:hypothetical protein